MGDDTKLLMMCIAAGAFMLVYAILRVLGTWFDHHIERHNLVVESRQRRIEYYQALAARDNPELDENATVEIVEEDEPAGLPAFTEEPEMAQAA